MDLKVIVRLGDLSNGTVVTLPSGKKKYQVERSITIYDQTRGEQTRVHAREGTIFLTGSPGFIDAYSVDKEVIWNTTLDELNARAEEAEGQ